MYISFLLGIKSVCVEPLTMSQAHPFLFDHLMNLLRKIDQSNYALEHAEHVLELLHFCADEGRMLLEADTEVREMMERRCQEYHETAKYYQKIAEEATQILMLLRQNPTVTRTAIVATPETNPCMSYDPNAHHC